ncbi:MAG: YbhB/YbcL family Raf kinase inhibitor-like protein [Candidatus Poribacteria bacterium]|nr:YbhB/YbcL family Raf kinase inhibitor-like protein [Candidatus Poribacteria bacterium]
MKSLKTARFFCCCVIFITLGFVGCGNDDDDDNNDDSAESKLDPNWQIQSTAFAEGQEIPVRYTCEGEDISPALSWAAAPAGTQSLALLMDDPDAPGGTFTHWILYNLPPERLSLDENIPREVTLDGLGGANQGANDFPHIGYGGPCPPPGETHNYRFRLFALNTELDVAPGVSPTEFLDAIEFRVIAEARLTGIFRR